MDSKFNPIRIRRSVQVTNVRSVFYYERYRPRAPYEENYPFWQITFLLDGEGTYTVEGQTYPFRAGEVLFRRAGRSSCIAYPSDDPVSLAIISFTCASEVLNALPDAPVRLYGEERATLLDLIRTGVRICEWNPAGSLKHGFALKQGMPEVVLEFVGVSLERFLIMVQSRLAGIRLLVDESEKSNRRASQSELANAIRRSLEERMCQRIRIDALAKEFGLSQTALMRLYKREFGASILEDLTRMKMIYARRRIASSGLNFTQIAEELGYSSAGYFSRAFRAHEGMTPTEYSRMVSKRV